MPFLALTISQNAQIHLPSLIGESSKIVPRRTVYCLEQSLHFHTLREARKYDSSELQMGHFASPRPQRIERMKSNAFSSSAKEAIASRRGSGISLCMRTL